VNGRSVRRTLVAMVRLATLVAPALAFALASSYAPASAAPPAPPAKAHACAADAKARAAKLLALHTESDDRRTVADKVTAVAPVKAARGKGKLDVLEVTGYVYKADYRMRFLYAHIPGTCALLGQEILEQSNPY
jgi:hypothetical protein